MVLGVGQIDTKFNKLNYVYLLRPNCAYILPINPHNSFSHLLWARYLTIDLNIANGFPSLPYYLY